MLLKQVEWLKDRSGWIAMLVKTAVARKVLRHVWKLGEPVGRSRSSRWTRCATLGAAVDACLFVLPVSQGEPSRDCDVFGNLEECEPSGSVGYHDDMLVADVDSFMQYRHFLGPNSSYVWRSGIKHDCAKVMDLTRGQDGGLLNGLGERVELKTPTYSQCLRARTLPRGGIAPTVSWWFPSGR